jgi:hypothetical protein
MKWRGLHRDHPLHVPYKWARRIVITITGFTVLFVGFAMIVLPGPAVIVIPAGLAILGLEFAWARHSLRALKKRGAILVAAAKAKLR